MELVHRTKFNEEWTFCVTLVWWKDRFFGFAILLDHEEFLPIKHWLKNIFDQMSLFSSECCFCRCRVGNWIGAGRCGAAGTLQDRRYMRQLLCASFFPTGNAFAHKYSEMPFLWAVHGTTCLVTQSPGRREQGRAPARGGSATCRGSSAGLGLLSLSFGMEALDRCPVVSVESWEQSLVCLLLFKSKFSLSVEFSWQ